MKFTSSVQSTLLHVRTLSTSCVLRYWYTTTYVICIHMQTCMPNTNVHNEVFSVPLPAALVFPWNRSLCWHSQGRSHTFALSCLCVSGTHTTDFAVGLQTILFIEAFITASSVHNSISVVIGSMSAGHLHCSLFSFRFAGQALPILPAVTSKQVSVLLWEVVGDFDAMGAALCLQCDPLYVH